MTTTTKKVFTSDSWNEFSTGIVNLKEKVNDVIDGTQVVAKATSATSATYATTATKAGSANSASTATADSKGQAITGYIKGFGISGKTITITKGDGSTATYTTQDTNTTYSNYKGATTAASGTAGLVPAATTATRIKFLRGDGTWQTPSSATSATVATSATYATSAGTATTLSGLTATVAELNYVYGVTSNIQTQLNSLASDIDAIDWFSLGTSIPTDSDLDTYTTVGKYFISSESGAQSLLNCPTTTNFCMYVIVRTNGSSKTQIIIALNGKMYIRSCNSSGVWRDWQRYATESDLSSLQSTLDSKADSDHNHSAATTASAGFMSKDDKTKLNGIATGANNYSHPTTSGNKHIPSGGSSGQILRWASDGTASWGADNNTTYANYKGATTASAGTAGLVPSATTATRTSFLRGDGTWATPTNTKVAQTELTSNSNRSILLASNNTTASATTGTYKSTKLKYNPSTDILTVGTIKGNLTGLATSATSDANGNNIANTYATKSSLVAVTTAQIDTLFT